MTGWVLLAAAIAAEVIATTTLTYSDGLTRHSLTALTVAFYLVSYICLAKALKAGMEISIAYAVWSGIGTAALAVIGASLFGEPMTLAKITAIALIVTGVLLLNLTGRAPPSKTPLTASGTNASTATAAHTYNHDTDWRPQS